MGFIQYSSCVSWSSFLSETFEKTFWSILYGYLLSIGYVLSIYVDICLLFFKPICWTVHSYEIALVFMYLLKCLVIILTTWHILNPRVIYDY